LDGKDTKYTKDYIQLSRKADFLNAVTSLFPVDASGAGSVPITYKWPKGNAPGHLVFNSADRPHLKWETNLGAPQAWKMSLSTNDAEAETIPGDPSHIAFAAAENEFALLASRGAGQPYLMAIKLRDEPRTLHLRAYLGDPSKKFSWANLNLTPESIQELAQSTSQRSALAWSGFQGGGAAPSKAVEDALAKLASASKQDQIIEAFDSETGRALTTYLRSPGYGLFFDPSRNHDAWVLPAPLHKKFATNINDVLTALELRFPPAPQGDAAAEALTADAEEVEEFRDQIKKNNYEVPDSTATVKTRGSAQRAFSDAVKANYGNRCAITGVAIKDFLIGSHIVPWSDDQTIRLDPSNGICLSLFVDRAFEKGYLQIDDDFTVRINWKKVGTDEATKMLLKKHDGQKLNLPSKQLPKVEYLQRRRALNAKK
jgi:hypothetical protein